MRSKLTSFCDCLCRVSLPVFLLVAGPARCLNAQNADKSPTYARRNSFGISLAYSPDSSHILLGVSEKRKLVDFCVSYGRRVHSSSVVNWIYEAEFSPVSFVGDPEMREIVTQTAPTPDVLVFNLGPPVGCTPFQDSYTFKDQNGITHSYTVKGYCHGRRWTAGQALLPIGMRWSFLPRRKLQPEFAAHVGYMFTTRPVPVEGAGSFNFVFDFGPGIELYRSHRQSLRLEYRFHHISNHDSAYENPGIDNGLYRLSYVFGR